VLSLGANSPPTAADDSYSTDEDTTLNVGAPGVLSNDSDADFDLLTAVLDTGPSNGFLTLNGDGSFEYIPNAGYNGPDGFTYHANDGTANSNSATVVITVNPANNNAPIAADDSATTDEDIAATINVLANDSDVDGDTLTVDSVTQGSNGTVTANGNDVTYTPAVNFNGSDSFSYTVSDGNGGTDTATVSVTINAVNDAPIAADDSATTDEDVAKTIDVLANDTDIDSVSLTVDSATQGSNGIVVNNGANVTYAPSADFNGTDSFTYTVSDGNGGTNTATVNITIIPVNDPPMANDDSISTPENTPVIIDVAANDTDVDGNLDTTTTNLTISPLNGSTNNHGDGTFTYTPNLDFSGSDNFDYEICDNGSPSLCDTATVSITVTSLSMHVGDLDAEALAKPRSRWDATVSITVHDTDHNLVSNATVTGSWSAGATGGASCVTNSNGTCTVTKSNLKSNVSDVTFTVDDISHTSLKYKASANHDPDADSTGTTIIIYQDGPPGNQPPVASFTYNCTELLCDFDASGSSDPDGNISSFVWDFGDGNTGSGVTLSHTYSEGTYTVVLTVTDIEGASATESQQIFLGNIQVMHVGDLDGSVQPGIKNRWNANIDILVHNDNHYPVASVTVSGSWSSGRSGSCVTDVNGWCTITLTNIKNEVDSIIFSVTELAAAGWEYDLQSNHDPDPDDESNGTSITINQ
jgi:PKD repeat protein